MKTTTIRIRQTIIAGTLALFAGGALGACGASTGSTAKSVRSHASTTTVSSPSTSEAGSQGGNAGSGGGQASTGGNVASSGGNSGGSSGGNAPSGGNSGGTAQPSTPAPVITSFTTPDNIDCHNGNFQNFTASWTTTNATKVTISIDGPGIYDTYGPNSSTSLPFNCSTPHTFLLTAFGTGGQTVTKQITLQPRNVQPTGNDQGDESTT